MATTRIRKDQVLPSASQVDQQTATAIRDVWTAATSDEDVEVSILSRLREIIFGAPDATNPDHWYDDFRGQGIRPLVELSGAAMDQEQHARLRQLVHLADGVGGPMEGWPTGAVREMSPAGPFPTSVIWWTDETKTKKIVSKDIVLDDRKLPTRITWTVYATDGTTALGHVTDTLTYQSVFEATRTRTLG